MAVIQPAFHKSQLIASSIARTSQPPGLIHSSPLQISPQPRRLLAIIRILPSGKPKRPRVSQFLNGCLTALIILLTITGPMPMRISPAKAGADMAAALPAIGEPEMRIRSTSPGGFLHQEQCSAPPSPSDAGSTKRSLQRLDNKTTN